MTAGHTWWRTAVVFGEEDARVLDRQGPAGLCPAAPQAAASRRGRKSGRRGRAGAEWRGGPRAWGPLSGEARWAAVALATLAARSSQAPSWAGGPKKHEC